MLDLKALLTKILQGLNYTSLPNQPINAPMFLWSYYNTSYSSAVANSMQFKSFQVAQYNHQKRSSPYQLNAAQSKSTNYAFNWLELTYGDAKYDENSYMWGIIYGAGVVNHANDTTCVKTVVGYQPSGSAYCIRENIKIPLPSTMASHIFMSTSGTQVIFASNAMYTACTITPYLTITSVSDVTTDTTCFYAKKPTSVNAMSFLILYWQ